MENETRKNATEGRPVPPDGGDEPRVVTTQRPEDAPATRDEHEEEPFDVLGGVSLFMGIVALFVMPATPWVGVAAPVAFSAFAIICGAIRLVDRRFRQRGDMAIAGMIASLLTLAFSVAIFAAGVFGNSTLGMLIGGSASHQINGAGGLRNLHMDECEDWCDECEDWCDECEDWCDECEDCDEGYDEFDDEDKAWHDDGDEEVVLNLDEEDDIDTDDADDEEGDASTDGKSGKGSRSDGHIRQAPVDDGKTGPSQAPLAKPGSDTVKQAAS